MMSMTTNHNMMDIFFDKEDPLLDLTDKGLNDKMEIKDQNLFYNEECWNRDNHDEFFESLLKFDEHPFNFLDLPNEFSSEQTDISTATSSCSDSEPQLSPMLLDTEDEENCPSSQEDSELNSAVYNLLDAGSFGEVKLEDNQAVISMNVVSPSKPHPRILRVTPVSGNPRSILLPVSLKDLKDVKAIKIVSANNGSNNIIRKSSENIVLKPSSPRSETRYPRLILTEEEKRLLEKEGVTLPSHYPLTKYEERELKRIRRKIRNKISAQDSRKRKKDYIDGLEERVKQCTEENVNLVKHIKALQSQNKSLITQLKKLQVMVTKGSTKTAQPATCLMVLILSLALVMVPNFQQKKSEIGENQGIDLSISKSSPLAGRSRNLLFSETGLIPEYENDDSHMEDFINSQTSVLIDHNYDPPPLKKFKVEDKNIINHNIHSEYKGFIEPPIDDHWPNHPDQKFDLGAEQIKINVSDSGGGTRVVVLQVPKEK